MDSNMVIGGIFIGIFLAIFASVYNRAVVGPFVRKLIKSEASMPGDAKSFEELGHRVNPFLAVALRRRRGILQRIVSEFDDGFGGRRYYIEPDKLYRAKRLYGSGVDVLMVVISLVLLLLTLAALSMAVPYIEELIKGIFAKSGEIAQ